MSAAFLVVMLAVWTAVWTAVRSVVMSDVYLVAKMADYSGDNLDV